MPPSTDIVTHTHLVHEDIDGSLLLERATYELIRGRLPWRLEIIPAYRTQSAKDSTDHEAHERRSHGYRHVDLARPHAEGQCKVDAKYVPLAVAALEAASVPYTIQRRASRTLPASPPEANRALDDYRYFRETKLFRLASPTVTARDVVVSILRSRPHWRAFIVAITAVEAKALHHYLVRERFDCELYVHGHVPGDREFGVSVGTCGELSNVMCHSSCPIVIYLDALSIFQKKGHYVWYTIGERADNVVRKSLYGILPYDSRVTPLDEYLLASMYGCHQQVLVGPGRVRRTVRVAWPATNSPRSRINTPDSLEQRITLARLRDQKISDLARAFVQGDRARVCEVLVTAAEVPDTHRNVLVLARDAQHRRYLHRKIGTQPPPSEIRVVDDLRGVNVDAYGLLIRADGRSGPLDIDVGLWGDEPGGGHPLVLVDFGDGHDHVLASQPIARQNEYTRLGWHDLSISAAEATLRDAYRPDEETIQLVQIMNRESQYLPPPRRRVAGEESNEADEVANRCEAVVRAHRIRSSKRFGIRAGGYGQTASAGGGPRRTSGTLTGTATVLPAFGRVFHSDNLLQAFGDVLARGDSSGPDGVRPSSYPSREIAVRLRRVSDEIYTGRYGPGPVREVRVPKYGGGYRVICVADVPDRVVARALYVAMEPFIDAQLPESMYGFRRGRSCKLLLADLERAILATPDPVLIQDDIRKAFDNVRLDLIAEDAAGMIPDGRFGALITTIARGGSPTSPERRTNGILQGNSISPALLLLHLHRRHDIPLSDGGRLPFAAWYADNRVCLAANETDAERSMTESRTLLGQCGLTLKGGGDGPARLGQPIHLEDEPAEVLGLSLQRQHERVVYRVTDTAWQALDEALLQTRVLTDPTNATSNIVRGWIEHVAPAIVTHGDAITRDVAQMIERLDLPHNRKWIRDTTSRAILNWVRLRDGNTRSNPLLRDETLELLPPTDEMNEEMDAPRPHPGD